MIIVTGSVIARPETLTALREASLDHVRRSRGEDGCLHHSVQADCENPLRLVFHERWRDMAALSVHFRVAGSVAFIAAVRSLAASSEPVSLYEASALSAPG